MILLSSQYNLLNIDVFIVYFCDKFKDMMKLILGQNNKGEPKKWIETQSNVSHTLKHNQSGCKNGFHTAPIMM